MKLSEATSQLTQVQRNSAFKKLATKARYRFAMLGGPLKFAHINLEVVGPVVNRFSRLHLQYWRETTIDPWVWTKLNKGIPCSFEASPQIFQGVSLL